MRIYESDGMVFVELNETIELCKKDVFDTLSKYKSNLLERISDRYDWTVTDAVLKSMKDEES